MLEFGVDTAKQTQEAIINQASALIQQKKIRSGQVFNHVTIEKDSLRDGEFFT